MYIRLRLAAFCTAVAMLLSSCTLLQSDGLSSNIISQSQSVPNTELPTPQEVRLPWFGEDTLNSYSCATLQNYYLAGLLADPLVALDVVNQPVNRLALEVASTDYLQYVITLRNDAVFSDGSMLTAEDVLYSLQLAQASPRFADGLRGVTTAVAPSSNSLTITLAAADRYFPCSLVFPILKKNTGEFPVPVGVGRFSVKLEENRLVRNTDYYAPVQNITQVLLVDTNSLEEQSYGIMEGTIDLMYSDLQSNLNLGLGIGYRQISLSNLVYIGVNHYRSWATKGMRQVLSGLVRREDIARKGYTGFGTATSIPINPVSAETALDVADLDVHLDTQRALLEQEGWLLQPDGSRRKNGITLSLELLVNTGNSERHAAAELLGEMFRQAGIGLQVTVLPFEQYKARISSGEYDLCIAEVRLAYNMEITSLLSYMSGGEFPVPLFPALQQLFYSVRAGISPQSELESMLRVEVPVIPLLFRRGILCFSRDFSANIVATEQDIFYNIGEW